MKKIAKALFCLFLCNSLCLVANPLSYAAIIKGPYLQKVTQNSMAVMWETDVATPSLLEYGTPATQLKDTTPVTIHALEITGLDPETTYSYRVAVDGLGTGAWTDPSTLRTAPLPQTNFRMAVYGDTRTDVASHTAVVTAMNAHNPEIVLHVGDLVELGKNYAEWETQFFTPTKALSAKTPLFPVLGNHEYSGSGTHIWFYDFFPITNSSKQWYAFTYGSARIIALNVYSNFSPGSAQYTWLITELTSNDFKAARWKFVYFHNPPFTSGVSHSGDTNVQTYLLPLFEQYGIDMVFTGHVHNYERSFKNDVHYITAGAGGAPLSAFYADYATYNPYSKVRVSSPHHCILDLTPTTLNLTAYYNNGSSFDTVAMLRFGDVSRDIQITAFDAALTAQASIDLITFSANQYITADVSGDGQVTAYDAALIAQKSIDLIDKFPAEGQ